MSRELTAKEYEVAEREAERLWLCVPEGLRAMNNKADFILGAEMAVTDAILGNLRLPE